MFTVDHSRATSGWKYNVIDNKFFNPETRQLKANMLYDNNLNAIMVLQKMKRKEELEKLEKDGDSTALQRMKPVQPEAMKIIEGHSNRE